MTAYERILAHFNEQGIQTVALDTPVFQGFQSNDESDPYNALFTLLEEGRISGVASPLTLQSGLVGVHKACSEREVVEWKNAILRYPNLSFKPINTNIATDAALFQAKHGVKLSLAILIALAKAHGAQVVVTKTSIESAEDLPVRVVSIDQLLGEEANNASAV